MHLVQILLPLRDNEGTALPAAHFQAVRAELTDAFGGVTTFSRAPATGLWEENGSVMRDDIIVYEVMTDSIEDDWWASYRVILEQRFRQDEVVIRALAMTRF